MDSLPDEAILARVDASIHRLARASGPETVAVHEAAGLDGSDWRDGRVAVILSGSFNPLHRAHLSLLEAAALEARRAADGAQVITALSLSARTVGKERPTGMALADRAWTMHASLCEGSGPPYGVALLSSHGLYLDQATALRAAMPRLADTGLWFAVGHDKVLQILDPRYYSDRDASLDDLFSRAGLLVAPRDEMTGDHLHRLLERPENRRFASRVRPVAIPPALAFVSSTAFRAGEASRDLVPPAVTAMITARRCY